MAILGRSIPNDPYIGRGSLADDPVLTTRPPLVVTSQPRKSTAVIFTARSSTEDAVVTPVTATLEPIVVTPPPRPRPGTALFIRGSLVDDPVLTTPPPLVLVQPARQRVATVELFRSSLEDVVVPSAATPQPITVTSQPKPRPGVAVLLRGSLYDATTLGPLVVVAGRPRPGAVISLERGSLADDPVLTTPAPIVVAAQRPRPPGAVAVFHAPPEFVAPPCTTTRPTTGTTGHTVTLTTRPSTGITGHTVTLTPRPDSGITEEPC